MVPNVVSNCFPKLVPKIGYKQKAYGAPMNTCTRMCVCVSFFVGDLLMYSSPTNAVLGEFICCKCSLRFSSKMCSFPFESKTCLGVWTRSRAHMCVLVCVCMCVFCCRCLYAAAGLQAKPATVGLVRCVHLEWTQSKSFVYASRSETRNSLARWLLRLC